MSRPAIVVVAFDRPASVSRLLSSIAAADFAGADRVPLVISIDGRGSEAVRRLARDFSWRHGPSRVIERESHLGLRDHVLACGDLSDEFGSVVILEDDLYVSPGFYDYTLQVLEFYGQETRICGASLYAYDFNEYARLRFAPIEDGFDTYFMKTASSWGQMWTREQWGEFRIWLREAHRELDPGLPAAVVSWPASSWKKLFIRFMADRDKVMVYPRSSLTTNFGDAGTHYARSTGDLQVPLRVWSAPFRFAKLEESLCIYDSHYELEAASLRRLNPDLAGIDFECDFYGIKDPSRSSRKHWLSARECSEPIRLYALSLVPHELNAAWNVAGKFFSLGPRESFGKLPQSKRRRQVRHLHKNAGLRLYAGLTADALRERIRDR